MVKMIKRIFSFAFITLIVIPFYACGISLKKNSHDETSKSDLILYYLVLSSIDDLFSGKNQATSVTLQDGSILICGGGGLGEESKKTCHIFSDKLVKVQDMSIGRNYHASSVLQNGNVLITGGSKGSPEALNSTEIYDPISGKFSPGPNMLQARLYHTSTTLNDGRILIVGGYSNYNLPLLYNAEVYNPSLNIFQSVGNLNSYRGLHKASLLNTGEVLITGGESNNGATTGTVEIFNPNTNTFSLVNTTLSARSFHTATIIGNGIVLLTGGLRRDASSPTFKEVNSIDIYNANTNTSVSISGFSGGGRRGHNSVRVDSNFVDICGGDSGYVSPVRFFSDCYRFNIANNTINTRPQLLKRRSYSTMNLLSGGKMILCGGNEELNTYLNSCEILDSNGDPTMLDEKLK